MITFTKEEINKTPKQVQTWYKQNLQGKIVKHPKIGNIIFYASGYDETRHWIAPYYMPIILKIKDIIIQSTTNGKIVPPKHPRTDGALGFIYLYNKIKYDEKILNLNINILVAKNEQKYYMFGFTKRIEESQNLDPGMFADANLSGGSILTSNNIITYFNENVKPDPENPKIGDVFWLGDSIRIEVVDVLEPKETKIQKLNKKLDEYLGD